MCSRWAFTKSATHFVYHTNDDSNTNANQKHSNLRFFLSRRCYCLSRFMRNGKNRFTQRSSLVSSINKMRCWTYWISSHVLCVCVCNSSKKYPLQSPCLLFTWHMQTNNLFSRLFLSRRLSLVLRIKDYPYQKLCCSSFPFIQCRFLSLFIQFVAIKLMLNLNLMSNFRSFIFILWNKNWIIKQKWSVENARCRLPGQFTHINMKAERYIT